MIPNFCIDKRTGFTPTQVEYFNPPTLRCQPVKKIKLRNHKNFVKVCLVKVENPNSEFLINFLLFEVPICLTGLPVKTLHIQQFYNHWKTSILSLQQICLKNIFPVSSFSTRSMLAFDNKWCPLNASLILYTGLGKKNRIYIRVEFRQSLGMNFVSSFQPEREFKVYTSCKCSQIMCSRVH